MRIDVDAHDTDLIVNAQHSERFILDEGNPSGT